jgi:hypothetical protein
MRRTQPLSPGGSGGRCRSRRRPAERSRKERGSERRIGARGDPPVPVGCGGYTERSRCATPRPRGRSRKCFPALSQRCESDACPDSLPRNQSFARLIRDCGIRGARLPACPAAAPPQASSGLRSRPGSFRLTARRTPRQHARQHPVVIDPVVLERRRHADRDRCQQRPGHELVDLLPGSEDLAVACDQRWHLEQPESRQREPGRRGLQPTGDRQRQHHQVERTVFAVRRPPLPAWH